MLHRLTRRLVTKASVLALAAGLLGTGFVPNANADTPAAGTPSAEAAAEARLGEAKRKFEAGVRAFGERRYADAARAFREADSLQPSAALSFNIARSYERLEDVPAALRWYRDYLRRSPRAPNRADVEKQIAELARRLEARGVQQLSVLVKPEGAEVRIDATLAGVAPFTLELPPGKHHLSARAGGYREQELDFVLEPSTPQDVSISLEKLAPVVASANAPARPGSPPPRAATRKSPFGVVPWLVLGAGAASSLAALGFELARRSAESDAERSIQLDYPDRFDTMHGRQTAARVLGVTGGVLLLGGATLLILDLAHERSRGVALGCTSSGCSLAASGTFE